MFKRMTIDNITSGLNKIVLDLDGFMDLESTKALTEESQAKELQESAQARIFEVERANKIKSNINNLFK